MAVIHFLHKALVLQGLFVYNANNTFYKNRPEILTVYMVSTPGGSDAPAKFQYMGGGLFEN
jgi:hypothetical protein